jgi:hypothetical protein
VNKKVGFKCSETSIPQINQEMSLFVLCNSFYNFGIYLSKYLPYL